MKNIAVVLLFTILVVGCQGQKDPNELPPDQAAPIISTVKNYKLITSRTVGQTIENAVKALRAKGMKVEENGWVALKGPADCKNCNVVNYVVGINGEDEKYEFLVKDNGKNIEGLNEGTKKILNPIPPAILEKIKEKALKQKAEKEAAAKQGAAGEAAGQAAGEANKPEGAKVKAGEKQNQPSPVKNEKTSPPPANQTK